MRGQFVHNTQVATFLSGATFSTPVSIEGVNRIALEIPTFAGALATTTANIYVQVSESLTGTFRRLKDVGIYSASSGIQDWEVPSNIGGFTVLCRPAAGFNCMKVEIPNIVTGGSYAVTVHKIN